MMDHSPSSSKHHLKHLLTQDQEPFILKSHIHDKRLQLKKQNPITQNSTNLCKNTCFFSFRPKSPLKTPSTTIFVHVPANTAALLLEAALRIQKQSEKPPKSAKNLKFGFLGSFLKKLRRRKKSEITKRGCENEIKVSVEDILRWESNDVKEKGREQELETNLGLEEKRDLCLSCNSRVSSVNWTEKSIELETSTSGCYDDDDEEEEEEDEVVQNGEFGLFQEVTSFRVFRQNGFSPCRGSPEFVSPATSPRKNQVAKNEEGHESSDGKQRKEEDWYSPVSVLDLQTEDDIEERDDCRQEDEDDSELERSFAIVQKAKQKLLKKLRRFERLAGLNPLELEKRIAEDDDENEDSEDFDDDDSVLQDNENGDLLIGQALNDTHCSPMRIPFDMKRLVIELMNEKGTAIDSSGSVRVKSKCCNRLGSMKNVEQNQINMMVQMDLRGEWNDCQKNRECVEETVVEVELAIFGFLVEEFVTEHNHSGDLKIFLELI